MSFLSHFFQGLWEDKNHFLKIAMKTECHMPSDHFVTISAGMNVLTSRKEDSGELFEPREVPSGAGCGPWHYRSTIEYCPVERQPENEEQTYLKI